MSTDDKSFQAETFNERVARVAVGGYDDIQDVRLSMMNRVRDIIRKKNEDIPFDEPEPEKEEDDYDSKYDDDNLEEMLDNLLEEDKVTEKEHKYISNMLETAELATMMENKFEDSMKAVEAEPLYYEWLDNVYGVSVVLTSKLIHQFGYCEKAPKVSNLWSYCGLAPGQERKKGEQLGYNPQAKTLAWLVADRMIMQGDDSYYKKEFYEPYKEKQEQRMKMAEEAEEWEIEQVENENGSGTIPVTVSPDAGILFKGTPPESQGHAHNRAVRYMAKKFLKHYWAISRNLKGYSTPDEWVLTHGGHEKREDTFENPFYAKEVLSNR